MRLGPYPEYKDSGVPWLGQVPVGWDVRKTKYLFTERMQKGQSDEPLLAATQTMGVVPKSYFETRTVTAQKDFHLLKLVKRGDFVISLRSFQGGIEFAHFQGIISPAYTVMVPSQILNGGYFKHLAKSAPFISLLTTCVTGIREGQNVDYEILKRNRLPVPALPEQIQIAHFLDYKSHQVSRFIRNKRRLIELASERLNAVTNEAMGSTGTRQLRIEVVADQIERPIDRLDGRLYTPVGLLNRGRGIFHKQPVKGSELGDSFFFWLEEGDLVLSGQFAWEGAIALAGQRDSGCVASHRYPVLRGRPDLVESGYLLSFFRTRMGHCLLDHHSVGAAGRNRPLNPRTLMKEKIPIPPLAAQNRIAALVKLETAIRRDVEREVALIQEYRTRLISDVVAGKIDVRGMEVPDLDDNTQPELPVEDDPVEELEETVEPVE